MKLSLTGMAAVAVLTAACGGSPTSPQSFDTRADTSHVDASNNPAPPAPPAPAPPAPVPTPSPAPAPPAPPSAGAETWSATVDVQRATPGSALPPTFDVTITGDQMKFGPLEVTILTRQGDHIYARKGQNITIQIDDGKWTVTSVPVFATGTITASGQ
jgi:hypothetical protein